MLRERRHAEIARFLTREGAVSVAVLAERLDASQATIRRDLTMLERDGVLTRVHGGATGKPGTEARVDHAPPEEPVDQDTVAKIAAELVGDGEALLLDAGAAIHRFATHLHGKAITVLTSNLAVYDEFTGDRAVELVLLGGVVCRDDRSTAGFLAQEALRQLRADRLFLSASGVRADGSIMDDTMVDVPLKRAMLAAADQVVLLADATRFPGAGLARVCGPDEVDVLVTSEGACPRTLGVLREAGVEVVTT
ncbi:MAG: DeoR family transcriptional regulator [Pseudonocardiaceae bacterium]|nr:DeoR family transcriptional regulator [Pseudonocardiaceae bacterium]